MKDYKPQLETETITKTSTATRIAVYLSMIIGVGAVIAIIAGLFTS